METYPPGRSKDKRGKTHYGSSNISPLDDHNKPSLLALWPSLLQPVWLSILFFWVKIKERDDSRKLGIDKVDPYIWWYNFLYVRPNNLIDLIVCTVLIAVKTDNKQIPASFMMRSHYSMIEWNIHGFRASLETFSSRKMIQKVRIECLRKRMEVQ